jgi:hypothetical protein
VSSSSSNIIKSGHKRKEPASLSHSLKDHPPNEIAGFRRVYRWSTGCSSVRPGGGLLRFLPNGVDARGGSTDPDSEFAFVFFFFFVFFFVLLLLLLLLLGVSILLFLRVISTRICLHFD